MFNPSQSDVRRFFCAVYDKWQLKETMDGIETIAALWIAEHPEYHSDLSDAEAATVRDYAVDAGRTNPFLHLSMHLSISEQCSIDQPRGIQAAVEALTGKLDSLHEAHHMAMEALGRMMWESQRSGKAPDGAAYIESIKKAASK
ncbi:MAG: DUF1841 family protein [Cytophagales bacterium]|nr:DUF1841 family protein [Cytophagales bacterium]